MALSFVVGRPRLSRAKCPRLLWATNSCSRTDANQRDAEALKTISIKATLTANRTIAPTNTDALSLPFDKLEQ